MAISLLNKLAPLAKEEWKLWPDPLSLEPGTSCSPFCCCFTLWTCRYSSQAFRDLHFCQCWWCFTAETTFCLSLCTCRSRSSHRDQAWKIKGSDQRRGKNAEGEYRRGKPKHTHTHTHTLKRQKSDARKWQSLSRIIAMGMWGQRILKRAFCFQKVSFFLD